MQYEPKNTHSFTEEMEVTGKKLGDKVKQLIEDGNVRRLIIRHQNGDVMLDVPLTPAVLVGGIFTFWFPPLAILVGGAVLLAKMTVKIERTDTESGDPV